MLYVLSCTNLFDHFQIFFLHLLPPQKFFLFLLLPPRFPLKNVSILLYYCTTTSDIFSLPLPLKKQMLPFLSKCCIHISSLKVSLLLRSAKYAMYFSSSIRDVSDISEDQIGGSKGNIDYEN